MRQMKKQIIFILPVLLFLAVVTPRNKAIGSDNLQDGLMGQENKTQNEQMNQDQVLSASQLADNICKQAMEIDQMGKSKNFDAAAIRPKVENLSKDIQLLKQENEKLMIGVKEEPEKEMQSEIKEIEKKMNSINKELLKKKPSGKNIADAANSIEKSTKKWHESYNKMGVNSTNPY
ncbi:MAG: hypothetical protein V1872_13640, partial [bacterium]